MSKASHCRYSFRVLFCVNIHFSGHEPRDCSPILHPLSVSSCTTFHIDLSCSIGKRDGFPVSLFFLFNILTTSCSPSSKVFFSRDFIQQLFKNFTPAVTSWPFSISAKIICHCIVAATYWTMTYFSDTTTEPIAISCCLKSHFSRI